MESWLTFRWGTASVLAMLLIIAPLAALSDDSEEQKELRKELDAVKQQLRRVEEQMKQQEELIRKLGGGKAAAPAAAAPTEAASEEEQRKAEALKQKILDDIEEKLQPALAAANKTFPSQFNPAIGFIVDFVGSYSRRDKANFEFRSGELGVSANIDPFARGFAIINGTNDGIEVEEAGIVTTSLPYNLTVKGGRFFADFGRLSKFHDHDLPFVNRPVALDTYVGGESQSDGVEVSWLAPLTSQYVTLTGGWYNKMGAANDRADNTKPRDFSKFTYMGRANTYLNLADEHGADLGFSDAYTPKVDGGNGNSRNLLDVDFTYRYTPLSQASYRGLIWGNEFLVNHETRDLNATASADQVAAGGTALPPDFHHRNAFGMYSYLEARLSRVVYPGFLFEYVEDLDRLARATKGYSPYLTLWASEFQRFRLQYTHLDQAPRDDDKFFLQWTVILGSHVHSFRDR
jgi:hypothetical protein